MELINEYRRVIQSTDKLTWSEFRRVATITATGLFVIGLIGFIIYALFRLL